MKNVWLTVIVIWGILGGMKAQICEGNLGQNIFTEGDFGSGAANVIPADPGIAPGYIYQTNPPPNDGYYTITNDIGQWPTAFSWLEIEDNSPDPNGYMMVVNAGYDPGRFYEQEVVGLCDNTLYVFSVDVHNLIATGSNKIKPNITFLLDDEVAYTTGDIPENEQWNTYGFTFTTEPGQTSITLSLRNNAPGGIGNDIALDNITFRPCGPQALILPTTIANICEDGDPIALEATVDGDQYDSPAFQWQQSFDQGLTWQDIPGATAGTHLHTALSAGDYYYRYLLANGPTNLGNSKCRVVSNEKIVRVLPKFYTLTDTICQGNTFPLGDQSFGETGIYTDTFLNYLGCDSIVTLELTVAPDPGIRADFTLQSPKCSYTVDGSIQLEGFGPGTPPFNFSFEGEELAEPDAVISGLAAGDYLFSISDHFGCRLDTLLNLPPQVPFAIDLGTDQLVELGDEVRLAPETNLPIVDYAWSPADSLGCTGSCPTVEWLPLDNQWVSLVATSEQGCTATDSVFISVLKNREVYIPNVFSPNDDGRNDHFTLYGKVPAIREIADLTIFDRWGGVLFSKQNFQPNRDSEGWSGKVDGSVLPPGTYVYLAKVRFLDGVVREYGGGVTLLR